MWRAIGTMTDSAATPSCTPSQAASAHQNGQATLTAIIGTATPIVAPVSATRREEVTSICSTRRVTRAMTSADAAVENRYAITIARRVDRSAAIARCATGGRLATPSTSTIVSGEIALSGDAAGVTGSALGPIASMSLRTRAA